MNELGFDVLPVILALVLAGGTLATTATFTLAANRGLALGAGAAVDVRATDEVAQRAWAGHGGPPGRVR